MELPLLHEIEHIADIGQATFSVALCNRSPEIGQPVSIAGILPQACADVQQTSGSTEIREVVRLFFEDRDGLEPITKEELANRIEENRVIVLDVRPVEEYAKGHIPGALSIPLSQLKKRLHEIPSDHEVVAYCRGPYCVLSADAMKVLRSAGYKASRLKEGLPEWKQAGLPVEKT